MRIGALIGCLAVAAVALGGCGGKGGTTNQWVTTASGLQYQDVLAGNGVTARSGNTVTVHLKGWLSNGRMIMNTISEGSPIEFSLGDTAVLPAWNEALRTMRVGGVRKLIVPPHLGYGSEGKDDVGIPGNSTLIYELSLVNVERDDWINTGSGLKYVDLEVGSGAMPFVGQRCIVHYTGWLKQDGSEFNSTNGQEPYTFIMGENEAKPGFEEAVSTMVVGSRRRAEIPAELAYGSAGHAGFGIPPDAALTYEITLIGIVDDSWVTTASGLRYTDLEAGSGPTPSNGQTCVVHYTGWLEGEEYAFDSSLGREPLEPVIGGQDVIPGFEEALTTMTVGTKRRVIIPPHLGYGSDGSPPKIPGNATLIFHIQMVDIR